MSKKKVKVIDVIDVRFSFQPMCLVEMISLQ